VRILSASGVRCLQIEDIVVTAGMMLCPLHAIVFVGGFSVQCTARMCCKEQAKVLQINIGDT